MSNVVDSKVVELQFENKDFEKNATQSISTLKELKENLNFTGTTKGLEDINSSIKAVNFDNLANGIKEATNGFSMMETIAFGVFNRLGARIADFAVNSIGKIFTFLPRQIWTGGKSRSFNMEQAKFQIEGLGKEWEDISADIDYAVAGTAYGMDVAAKAASQLLASGVEFGEVFGETGNSPMAKALRGISGVAAMTGASYEEISRIFTTVAGQGRAMAGELNRIAERGLNGSKAIADFMNNVDGALDNASESVQKEVREITGGMEVTEADIRELASKGVISFGIFSEAMDAAFGEHATKANETFAGTISNIKAQLSKLGEVFISPAMEAAVPFLNNIYNIIKNLRTLIAGTANEPTAFMQGYLFLVKGITGGLEIITGAINGLVSGEGFDFIGTLKKLFGIDQAEEVAEEFSSSFETIRDTAFKVIKGDYGYGMDRMNKLTEEGFDAQSIQDYVNALWEVSGHDWSKIFDEDIQKQAADMVDLSEATEEYGDSTENAVDKQKEEQRALREMSKEMTNSERTMFGLINIFDGIAHAFNTVKEAFKSKVKLPTFSGILETLTTNFLLVSQQFNNFVTQHADDIAAVFTGIANAALIVVDVFRTLLKIALAVVTVAILPFAAVLGGIILLLLKAATAVRNWAEENQIFKKITDGLNSTLTNAKTKIEGWWKAFTEFPAIKSTLEKLEKAFTAAFENAPVYLAKAKDAVVRFGSRAKNAFKLLWNKKISPAEFFERMKRSWTSFTGTISNFQFVRDIKDALSSAKTALDEWFTSLGTNEDGTVNTFGKIYDSIKNIGSVLGSAWVSAKEFVAGLDPLGFIGDKISLASSKFKELKASFVNFPGITENLAKFKEGLKSAFGNIPSFIGGAITHFGGFFQQVGSGFMKLIHGEYTPEQFLKATKLAFDNVVRYFTEFKGFDTFKESLKGLVDTAGNWIDSLGTNADGTRNAFGQFLDKAKEVYNWIVEKWEIVKEKVGGFFAGLDLDPEGLLNKFKILKQGIKTFIDGIPEWFSGLGGAIGDFFKRFTNLGENGALTFDNIMFIFGDTIGKYFKEHDVFAPIKAAFKLLFEDLKTSAKESFPEVFEAWEKIKAFFKDFSIPKALSLLPSLLGSIWKALKHNFSKKLQEIGDGIGDIGKFITDHLKDFFTIDTSKVVGVLVGIFVLRKILGALTAFNMSHKYVDSVGTNMLKVVAAIGILALIITALSKMSEEDALRAGIAAGAVLIVVGVLSMIMIALSVFADGPNLMACTTAMLELSGALAILTLIVVGLTKTKWETFGPALLKLGAVIALLAATMFALSFIGPVGAIGATAALELAASIGIIIMALNTAATTDMEAAGRNLAKGFKAFCDEIEGLEISEEALAAVSAVTKALTGPGWTALFGAMGECIANILPGTGEDQTLMERFQASADTLATTVKNWSDTMAGITPNPEAESAVIAIQTLVDSCNESGMISAIESWVGNVFADDSHEGQSTMERFQKSAETLSDTVKQWTDSMNGITVDKGALKGVYDLRDCLNDVSGSGLGIAIDSFVSNILSSGEDKTTVERFGEGVTAMADALRAWNDGMKGKNGEDPVGEIVQPPIGDIRQLSRAIDEIPDMGLADHIANFIAGGYASTEEIGQFKEHLTALAEAITAWNEGMTVDGQPVTVTNIDTEAIKNLADGLANIPSDSIFSKVGDLLTGTNDSDEAQNFKTNLSVLGEAIAGYVAALAGTEEEDVHKATKILKAMADFSTALMLMDYGGGGGKNANGLSDIENFAGLLTNSLVPAINDFITKAAAIEDFQTVVDGLKSITALSEISLTDGDLGNESAVSSFISHVDSIVEAMNKAAISAFMTSAGIGKLKENVETLSSTKLTNDDAASSGADAAGAAADEIAKSKSSFNDAMGEAIGGAIDAINGASSDFSAAGFGLVMQVALGMRKAKSNVDLAAAAVVDGSEKGIRNKRTDFYSAGSYVAQGFADGMKGKYSEVWNKAVALARQALDAIRKTTKEASPSKVTHQMGLYVGEGFVNGISEYAKRSYDAGKLIADEARKGVQRAVRTINRVVSGGMDATPVIRPVLDLSEIQNGAASISSLLNTNPSLALAGNLTAINSNLLSRTDPNADVIDAIDSLKSTIASTPRTVNNINGVTYDDGSNITSAIETIVHAARVERRV